MLSWNHKKIANFKLRQSMKDSILNRCYNLKKVMLFTLLLTAGSGAFSQTSEDSIAGLRKYGFGLHIEQILSSDSQLPAFIYPFTKIVFTYNVNSKVRLEPKLGFIKVNDKTEWNQDSTRLHLELGAFLMTQREKINIYYGISTGYNFLMEKFEDYLSDDTSRNITNRLFIGPKAGGEYFIGKHFSLSGEVGISFYSSIFKIKGGNRYYDPNVERKKSYNMVTSGVIMRFYF